MNGGQPRYGGTLRLYGPGSMDHLDPACAYYMLGGQIIRLFARQLFTYRPVADLRDPSAITPVPDVAEAVPTPANGGISDGHTRYTVRLRPGVYWDTDPPREVTAGDFVRGFKRMANPVLRAGGIGYFTSTIRGMAEYCDAYAAAITSAEPTAAELADFQNSHEIAGVRAADDRTIVFELVRPAVDFLHILALHFASAAPVEYDEVLPDSAEFRRRVRANGPYRVVEYVHGESVRLERNPMWRRASDPVRQQYLDGVEVTMEVATPQQVGEMIDSGRADLSWASPITEPYDVPPTDPGNDLGYALNPYLVFNMLSPNADRATSKLRVRQAIAYAINKAAIAEIYHDLEAGTVMLPGHTAIPPGNDGHVDFNLYPTPGDRGDPERCRALLAEAGYPDGLTLTAVHRDVDANPEVARSYATDLEKGGISVRLVALGHAEYYQFLRDPANARAGAWDISAPSWTPDWFGPNGRTYVQPMFQTNTSRGTSNYGGYSNPEVDRLIEEALGATDRARATELWHQVDLHVMRDAAIVPILVHAPTIPHRKGRRVRNAIAMPTVDRWFDLSNLWLEESE
ncbi:ABC transporter substrate-binding protein [Micromonospora marina]|uniref:Peptide/nickel transport system substrate-binding protein n=1 Tax=Micromonospora marina TaxID=307120 RepID=A0A1C4V9H0_9ACTN|nr:MULTISPECIES: ABC transporter substrate-binding protein [Micromonospora]SCE80628.1 peptide/nickel transport system substrate-binding protein [Micromonospora marina]